MRMETTAGIGVCAIEIIRSYKGCRPIYLLNSSSTEQPSTPMSTVRHSVVYESPLRTKDHGCSQRTLFCSNIMRVRYVSRVTHAELDKLKWEQLDHSPYNSDMSGPLKKHLKGKLGRQTQDRWERLGLVMATGILGKRNLLTC
ncbi:hypothetical protein TNCV_1695691 [Trichonephila clavipes]|nr:hypothetical protein TNCV_1695691 [Trichonephila clavipes]